MKQRRVLRGAIRLFASAVCALLSLSLGYVLFLDIRDGGLAWWDPLILTGAVLALGFLAMAFVIFFDKSTTVLEWLKRVLAITWPLTP